MKFFVFSIASQVLDVSAEAVAAGGIEEQLDQCFLPGFNQLTVHTDRILIKDVRVLHAVYEKEFGFEVLG